ncbi:MAG TPA: macro domain-containing protein [Roseiflexaceae bacterium]|nr:macro domain-containing protein [Roseiflexaceae bacterium]
MPQRTADYKINKTTFRVCYGNITELVADALVSSDDNYLTMSGGVSLSLLLAGGETIQREARKQVPLKAGDVAVTSAGYLKAKFIFHAVTIDYDKLIYPNEEIVCSATER